MNKIVKWWNKNAFLGFLIDDIEDIEKCFMDFNVECMRNGNKRFSSILEMLRYYQKQSNIDNLGYNYFAELEKNKININYLESLIDWKVIQLRTKKNESMGIDV